MEAQRPLIRTMLTAIPLIRDIRPTMTVSACEAFWLVAQKEGLTVGDYAKQAGVAQTTMSRHLQDLGEYDRRHDEGAGLIESRINPMNRRERLHYLTAKGRALLAAINKRVQQ
jgi:DNA-binding MarR family transcriptional regulator